MPFHSGAYEIKMPDGTVEMAEFVEGRWATELPFEKWRGIDCSLAKRGIKKLKRPIESRVKFNFEKLTRDADSAVKIARHYFGLEIKDTTTGKSKTFEAEACRFYRIANGLIDLSPADRHAFEAAAAASNRSFADVPKRELEHRASRAKVNIARIPEEL